MNARGVLVAATAAAALMTGCTSEHPTPSPPPATVVPTAIPAYDGSLRPAQAVQALVPLRARTIRVVDWAEIRRQVGLPELTGRSPAVDRAAFAARSAVDAPLLDPSVLAPDDARLRAAYGFGADDLAWEAHFLGGGSRGWVLAFGPGVDMAAVSRAVRAGVGRLRGAHVDTRDRLVTQHVAAPGEPVWGGDPVWARLVPGPGEAVVVHRGCLATHPRSSETLQPIAGFAITFGDHVATVRVGRDRGDLFARVRLGRDRFGRVFRYGVADPATGRIGYDVPHPSRAAALVRSGDLPFGTCAPGD